jgi:hypothetical protein
LIGTFHEACPIDVLSTTFGKALPQLGIYCGSGTEEKEILRTQVVLLPRSSSPRVGLARALHSLRVLPGAPKVVALLPQGRNQRYF